MTAPLSRKGDLLFKVQQDQYKAQLQQAQSQVLAAKAALVYASTEVVRYTELVKKEAAAQIEVDHWVYERHRQKPSCSTPRPRSCSPS